MVTDRLHGHIVSILLDIPTVMLDTKSKKCSNFYNTWTRGMEKVRLAVDDVQASEMAMELLTLFGNRNMTQKNPTARF